MVVFSILKHTHHGSMLSTSKLICGYGHHVKIIDVGWRDFIVKNSEGDSMTVKFCEYENYFYTDKEMRKLKLEEIGKA